MTQPQIDARDADRTSHWMTEFFDGVPEAQRLLGFVAKVTTSGRTVTGDNGDNLLDGRGGTYTMIGLGGDDTYLVDSVGDRVLEKVKKGNDTVISTVSFELEKGQEIETLELDKSTGKMALSLTGNEFANTLRGNDGDNRINGGTGADSLYGKAGDDAYTVDHAGDRVFEAIGQGRDLVSAKVSYKLAAGQEIEQISASQSYVLDTANIHLAGNEFNQLLFGNAGTNKLSGGLGNDVLTGRGGADTFIFSTKLGNSNVDRIMDFTTDSFYGSSDMLQLSKAIFSGLTPGHLSESAFKAIDTAKVDANDRLLYKQTTGELFYDADGSGKGVAVLFAVLDNHVQIDHTDVFVV